MACFGPLTAYYGRETNPITGRRPLVFDPREALSGEPMKVPCGRCIGCRRDKALGWAVRCMHEKQMHPLADSAFVTLTYNKKHLPRDGGLNKRHLQLFMKRLRKARFPGIRFFASGEYGEQTKRPHYHVLLFNTGFSATMRKVRQAPSGADLYHSVELEKLWQLGDSLIGDVTFDSCAYVAGYVVKKITGPPAEAHYAGRAPEFGLMSRNPGIGSTWFQKYYQAAFDHDSVVLNQKLQAIPHYYKTKFAQLDSKRHVELRRKRALAGLKKRDDNTSRRRRTKEEVLTAKLNLRTRKEV